MKPVCYAYVSVVGSVTPPFFEATHFHFERLLYFVLPTAGMVEADGSDQPKGMLACFVL